MTVNFLFIFLLCLGASSARSPFQTGISTFFGGLASAIGLSDPFGVEGMIKSGIEDFRTILKEGNAAYGLPGLDPIFIAKKPFNFTVDNVRFQGFFENVTVSGYSDFSVEDVDFSVFPYPQLRLKLFWPKIDSEGIYNMTNTAPDNQPSNAVGRFTSQTENITVTLEISARLMQQWFQISDLKLEYEFQNETIRYTNGMDSEEFFELDRDTAMKILKQLKAQYLPKLLASFKAMANYLLLTISYSDIQNFVLGFFS